MSSFVINTTFDSSVTNLETTNPALYTEFTSAVQTAVQFYESEITNAITVNIDFGWGEVAGAAIGGDDSGESSTYSNSYTYTQFYNALKAADTTSPVQLAAIASLPTVAPAGVGTVDISFAEQKALGLTPARAPVDGYIGLNSSEAWSWMQSSVAADTDDAVGVLEHEISEVLGRTDIAGGGTGDYHPLDFFRYTAADGLSTDAPGAAAGVRDEPFAAGYSANAYSYFSYNGTTVTLPYETPTDVADGADIADWSPAVPNDSYADDAPDGANSVSTTDLQELNVLGYDLSCFAAGTCIATPEGEVAVETLRAGDLVLAHAADGDTGFVPQPVVWAGFRAVRCNAHAQPRKVWPVRVRQGTFGANMPAQDLLLSPDHAVFVDGVLIPVKLLCNGNTIAQMPVERLTYYHIELAAHAVLLANGLPVESYLDTGGRANFSNGGTPVRLFPDFAARVWEAAGCAPLILTGPKLDSVRATLGAAHRVADFAA